jgi:nicotinamide-nucleotide amidase
VTIELINTGSELMLGRVLNTHQQWLCTRFADLGRAVTRQVAVPDGAADIESAVREGLSRADLVVTTGGLGPTCDDITRERIAGMLGLVLHHDPAVEAQIRSYFVGRGRPVPERTKVEAMVPEGALVLANRHGTAPGLAIRVDPNPFREDGRASWLVMLPGPPRELRPMFDTEVAPLVLREFPLEGGFACRTLKTTGIGESYMEELVSGSLRPLTDAGMDLGFCARVGEVDVRFVARGPTAAAVVAEAERITRGLAAQYIFGEQDDTLESVLVRELARRGQTLALAESCTGGHIANRITNVPGASAVLNAGFVTYANAAKVSVLGVPESVLRDHGAVSEPTARAMAEGARRVGAADWAISVTGIAGPSGGTTTKPVGTVHFAIAGPDGTEAFHQVNAFDRETFKYITAQQAMSRLLRRLAAASGSAPVS